MKLRRVVVAFAGGALLATAMMPPTAANAATVSHRAPAVAMYSNPSMPDSEHGGPGECTPARDGERFYDEVVQQEFVCRYGPNGWGWYLIITV